MIDPMTFLALDVGNTRLKWAVYDRAHAGARLLKQGAVFLENIDHLAEREWASLDAPQYMLGCVVAVRSHSTPGGRANGIVGRATQVGRAQRR